MNYEFQVELSYSEMRTLKIWKTVIIIHGILCFLLVYLSLIQMIIMQITPWEFYIELVREIITDPSELFFYVAVSLCFNLFTIPRLLALYSYIKSKIMGKTKLLPVLLYVVFLLCGCALLWYSFCTYLSRARKPVIYLYPETKTEVNVKLELDGKLTVVYPNYDEVSGWTVTAEPDGTLTDSKGRKYSYLYWEGDINIKPDMDKGFCVKGEDTAAFLEDSLKQLGLTDKEADDFITYWLPMMQGNEYNVITFQTKAYEEVAALHVSPRPDTVIRVNMLWYSSKVKVNIRPQELGSMNPAERKGFTVVEWGGEEYKKGKLLLESMV
jgi:hypothetical protein